MPKILYVEDEPFLAKIVKESLESREFEVIHVDNGNDAFNEFLRHKPEICVLDVMLPGKNGFEIAKEIRAQNSDIPILFLTAKDQTDDLISGFESGGNDYIKKPFSMAELIVRILNLIKLTKGKEEKKADSIPISLGEHFKFSSNSMQLIYGSDTIDLSFKENQIMELLTENINENIDRKKILLHVWNDDSYFNSRNLDVYMRKLRKYLSKDEKLKLITLKGIGYRFYIES